VPRQQARTSLTATATATALARSSVIRRTATDAPHGNHLRLAYEGLSVYQTSSTDPERMRPGERNEIFCDAERHAVLKSVYHW
jgi:hypothetical protein